MRDFKKLFKEYCLKDGELCKSPDYVLGFTEQYIKLRNANLKAMWNLGEIRVRGDKKVICVKDSGDTVGCLVCVYSTAVRCGEGETNCSPASREDNNSVHFEYVGEQTKVK